MKMFQTVLLVLVSFVGAIYDCKSRRIPNWLTFGTLFIALFYWVVTFNFNLVLSSLFGFLVGIALLVIPYFFGAMGAGDVKLLGAIGSLTGFKDVILVFFYSTLCGLFLSLIWIVLRPGHLKFLITTGQALPPVDKSQKFPYGVPIFLGTILYIISESVHFYGLKHIIPLWQ